MWETQQELHLNEGTALRFLAHLERFRYYVDVREQINELLCDAELRIKMEKHLDWSIEKDA